MATFTASHQVATAIHAGIVGKAVFYTLTSTFSINNVYRLMKIPNHATLLDCYATISAGHQELVIEDDQTPTQFTATISASSGSGMIRATKNLPLRYSLTDSQAVQHVWLGIGAGSAQSAAATIGAVLKLVAFYKANDPKD